MIKNDTQTDNDEMNITYTMVNLTAIRITIILIKIVIYASQTQYNNILYSVESIHQRPRLQKRHAMPCQANHQKLRKKMNKTKI